MDHSRLSRSHSIRYPRDDEYDPAHDLEVAEWLNEAWPDLHQQMYGTPLPGHYQQLAERMRDECRRRMQGDSDGRAHRGGHDHGDRYEEYRWQGGDGGRGGWGGYGRW